MIIAIMITNNNNDSNSNKYIDLNNVMYAQGLSVQHP